jgi:diacylglycerol kinase
MVRPMRMEPSPPETRLDWGEPAPRPSRRRRRWRTKFKEAFRGVKLGARGQASFAVHFFFAALAIAFAVALECTLVEWCILVMCIGGVITAELFNSAIETLFHGLDEATRSRWNGCLQIAAGAVFVASATALVVGLLIFVNRLASMLG